MAPRWAMGSWISENFPEQERSHRTMHKRQITVLLFFKILKAKRVCINIILRNIMQISTFQKSTDSLRCDLDHFNNFDLDHK